MRIRLACPDAALLLLVLIAGLTFLPIVPCHAEDAPDLAATRKAAEGGFVVAQYSLGLMYSDGYGVPQDYKQAVAWYSQAAGQGLASAQYNLGVLYAEGRGVSKDDKQALSWIRKAAAQGHAKAQYSLGARYKKGDGVPQDYKQALSWYTKAAKQGEAAAQRSLGLMYREGLGVPHDNQQAAYWYDQAAKQGHAQAQHYSGMAAYLGLGVPKDNNQAYAWLSLAAASGNQKVLTVRDHLAGELTVEDLKEAEVLAGGFQKEIDWKTRQASVPQQASKKSGPRETRKWLETAAPGEKIKFWSQLAAEMNKNLPMNIDAETIAIKVANQADGVVFDYLKVNMKNSAKSKAEIAEYIASARGELQSRFCSSPDTLFLREVNAALLVNYFDRDGKFIGKVEFTAGSDCRS